MSHLSDYDIRQLNKMAEVINVYKRGEKSLHGLLGDTEFLINVLEDVSADFSEALFEEWSRIEIVCALTIYDGKDLKDSDIVEINDAVDKLLMLISIKDSN